jgi:PAS domain S-box-containing protein
MTALGGWSLVYGVQLGFTTAASQELWQRVSLAIGGTIPTLGLFFTLHYLERDEWLTQRWRAVLAVDPVLFALLTLTNPVHELIWDNAALASTRAGSVLDLSLAVGYYVHIFYGYVIVAFSIGLFFRVFERTRSIYRRQTGFLILGVIPPFLGNIVYTFRVSLGPFLALDPTPFLFVLTGVLWALALYQFDLLDRTPLARQRIIDEMGDGLVVLDADREIVNANAVARRALTPDPEVGRSITELTAEETASVEATRDALDGQTITARVNGQQRVYDVDWSSLTDGQGTTVGHMIALRDVTERNEYQQRLEVAQRVLRHNLRNKMTVVRVCADELSETATTDQAEAATRISETAEDLIELSEKTHAMVQMGPSTASTRVSIDVQARLASIVAEFTDAHPEVTIEYAVADSVELRLPDRKFLRIPVENLVENAIQHNDTDDPWVRVGVESTGEQVRIRVEDNGPPIPEMERRVLEEGREDSLNHGSGLGLWLTYWSVRAVGGRVTFEQREPRGNAVTLEIPAVD